MKVAGPEELIRAYEEVAPSGLDVMVQSVIPGPTETLIGAALCLSANQECLASYSVRKLRQTPAEFGIAALAETIYDPEAIALSLRFLQALRYQGIGHIEFKRDPRDGKLKFLELNARFWLHLQLAVDAGIDFPLIQYRDLTGDPLPPQTRFQLGLRWLDLFGDVNPFLYYRSRGELSLSQWIRSCLTARSFAYWAADDPNPWLRHTLSSTLGLAASFLRNPRLRPSR